jgi:leucine-rich repeat-containing G protein-coupled receptor 6
MYYLFFISGEFKTFAIQWQTSSGCLVAGFLGVVSSELSVFTLMIITVERHYAIANAMQFNKRVSLRKAGNSTTLFALFVKDKGLPRLGYGD